MTELNSTLQYKAETDPRIARYYIDDDGWHTYRLSDGYWLPFPRCTRHVTGVSSLHVLADCLDIVAYSPEHSGLIDMCDYWKYDASIYVDFNQQTAPDGTAIADTTFEEYRQVIADSPEVRDSLDLTERDIEAYLRQFRVEDFPDLARVVFGTSIEIRRTCRLSRAERKVLVEQVKQDRRDIAGGLVTDAAEIRRLNEPKVNEPKMAAFLDGTCVAGAQVTAGGGEIVVHPEYRGSNIARDMMLVYFRGDPFLKTKFTTEGILAPLEWVHGRLKLNQ